MESAPTKPGLGPHLVTEIILAVFICLFPLLAHSRSALNSPSKSAANEVVVDVVVTDESHHPVEGLRQQDFQIFEGNKKQTILLFEVHEARPAPELPKPSLPANTFTNASSFPPDSISVILLDQLNTSIEDQRLAHQRVIDFIAQKPTGAAFAIFTLRNDDEACQPYDSARSSSGIAPFPDSKLDWGCASMGRLLLVQGITADKDRLIAALKTGLARPRRTWLRQRVGMMEGGWGFGWGPFSTAFGPASLNPWTLAPGSMSSPWPVVPVSGFLLSHGFGYLPPAMLDNYGTAPLDVFDTSMSSLAELGHFLQNLPGRKSLIWMSDSFDAAPIAQNFQIFFPPKFRGWEKTDVFSPVQMTHLAAGRLALARVTIYPADLNGKNSDVDLKRMCGTPIVVALTSEASKISCDDHSFRLSYLASQSGGTDFHGAQKIQEALAHAATDEASYYSLTYSPTNTRFDGSMRSIKIAVNGKDYHLAYRKHYYADDPSALNRPETEAAPEIYLPNPEGPLPWKPVRFSDLIPASSDDSKEPIMAAMRYGAPESNDIAFVVHAEPTDKLVKATREQMDQLQEYESFRTERIQNAMEHLTKEQKKTQHKGRTVLDDLPPADPVFLQPYSIDYTIAGKQPILHPDATGDHTLHFEVALLAYDALGKRVTGLKQTVDDTVSADELQQFQSSGYHFHQTIDIPERATLLRLAIRDVSGNRIGSLEIPIWAISSPYRRKQLELPPSYQTGRPDKSDEP
jgi:VWFA-related protein